MNTRNLTPPVDPGPAGTAALAADETGRVVISSDPLELIDDMLDSGLDSIKARLVGLRAQRDECNAQIRVLVAQLAQLDRLAKDRQPRPRRKGRGTK